MTKSHREIGRLRKLAVQLFTAGGRLDIIFGRRTVTDQRLDKNKYKLIYLNVGVFFYVGSGPKNLLNIKHMASCPWQGLEIGAICPRKNLEKLWIPSAFVCMNYV